MRILIAILFFSYSAFGQTTNDTIDVPIGKVPYLTVCPEIEGDLCDDLDRNTYYDAYRVCKCTGRYDPNEDVVFTGIGDRLGSTSNNIEHTSPLLTFDDDKEFFAYSTKKLPANTDGWIECTPNEFSSEVARHGNFGFTTQIGHPSGLFGATRPYYWYFTYNATGGKNNVLTAYHASSQTATGGGQTGSTEDAARVYRVARKDGNVSFYIDGQLYDNATVKSTLEIKLYANFTLPEAQFNNCKLSDGWVGI